MEGVGYRDASGQIVVQPNINLPADLDAIPFPARHLLPMEKYFTLKIKHGGYKKRNRPASLITSRGCPYYCNFCTAFKVFGRKTRMRSVPNVIAEIDELVSKYGVDELYFEDDQLLAKVKRAEKLFESMIAKQYNLAWDTPNGVSPWLLNDDILAKMKASGCYRVNIAMESGNQFVLDKIINKPVKIDEIPKVVNQIRKHGMDVTTFIVAGNIGWGGVETKEQIRDSFRLVRRIGAQCFASILTPYPGSEVLEIAEKNDYLIPDFSWDNLVISKANLHTPEWTPEELVELVQHEKIKTNVHLWLRRPWVGLLFVWHRLRKNPLAFSHATLKYIAKLAGSYIS
jgi:magnesium-protoporphyrin IX monomethyl ester (oxidative) cyclase